MSCFEKIGKRCTPDCGFSHCIWETETKLCPFCDSISSVVEHDDEIYSLKPKYTYDVTCDTCGASTAIFYTKKEAIEAWNKRC